MDLKPIEVRLADGSLVNIPLIDLPDDFDTMLQSWDMAFKDLKASDYVVGGVWGARGANRFLLDQKRERLGFPETLMAVKALSQNGRTAQLS